MARMTRENTTRHSKLEAIRLYETSGEKCEPD